MKKNFSNTKLIKILIFSLVLLAPSCTKDNLSLWNQEAPAKKALIEYVNSVCKKNSPDFIPVQNRIAVFDLDGTLFCETNPTYFDFQLFVHRVLDDKSYTASEEQLAIAQTFRKTGIVPPLGAEYEKNLALAYAGMTLEELNSYAQNFMEEAQPGYANLKRKDAFYKPMVQLVEYLEKNKFKVYISSGTNRLLLRTLQEPTLHLPPYQVIGSDNVILASNQQDQDGLSYTFQKEDQLQLAGLNIIKNLQTNKVTTIVQEIGVQPVLAFGNSLTDASMVNYTLANKNYKSLGFMLLCDDTQREYGNLKKAQSMQESCEQNNWIPISMKNDWKTIYGDNVKKSNN